MNKVVYVREADGGRINIGITTEDGSRGYCVPEAMYLSLGSPQKGRELTDVELDSVYREDELYRAMKKALSLLSFSDKNKKTLYRKLIESSFSRDAADAAVERCLSLGYIDECRQLRILILREANISLRGPKYIKEKLFSKGYSAADIDKVCDQLIDEGEIDLTANLEKLFEKKGAKTREERRILMFKYGYRASDL